MGTIYVWLLIVQAMPGANSATVYVIDNITTQAECERVQKAGAVKAFLMADNPDDLRCAQWVIANGSAKRRDGDE